MSKPSTAREALLADLIGDVQLLLDRVELADKSAKETAQAIVQASALYRAQVDDVVAMLRVETASLIHKTTEHAAKSLVGQQQKTLQEAAVLAIGAALEVKLKKRANADLLRSCAIGGAAGGCAAAALFWFMKLFS